MRVSLKDVAQRAGVSVKTVSNVVNNYQHVTPAMRERVQRAIDELGYRPNLVARHLRKGRTGIIALAVPELNNPYFAELAGAVIDCAAEYDYTVLLDHTAGVREKEILVSQGFRSHVIDGLILSPIELEPEDLRARTESAPLVLLGEREYDEPYDHILIDNIAASRTAVRHLIDLGRRRIAFLGARHESARKPAHLRQRGWSEELTTAGLAPEESLVVATHGYDRRDGATAMAALLARGEHPDAVFAFNDLVALGAMRTLAERGLRVPQDVAVVGFDDIDAARFTDPPLTTVRQPIAEVAGTIVQMLVHGVDAKADPVIFPTELIVRDST